jgi:anti-sigma regulatory factor (Ser/Thr protein kinase)
VNQQVMALASDFSPAASSVVPASSRGRPRHVRLAALPSAVPWARRILRHMLREWQLESMSDPALLLVSELVTNAVKASASQLGKNQSLPMIGLTLQLTEAGFLAEVWDASPALPVLQESDLTGERGHGLVLVDFLADSWGHHAADGGKVVWFTVAVPDRAQLPHSS